MTLLDAILQAGVNVAYSCKSGRCGSCEFRLIDGVAYDANNGAISELGVHLACASRLGGDVEIVMKTGLPINVDAISSRAKIARKTSLGDDALDLWLSLPKRVDFDFIPGQYLDVSASGVTRSYSIAGYDIDSHSVRLIIKRQPGGAMSSYWFDGAISGDLVSVRGPLGGWTIPVDTSDKIFIAGGSGIAPFLGYLSKATEADRVRLFWGVRDPDEIIPREDPSLSKLKSVELICSTHQLGGVDQGYVYDLSSFSALTNLDGDFYICGGEVFVDSVAESLLHKGVSASKISKEIFFSTKA